MQRLRVLLCFQHQLCRQQSLVLILRYMRPVHNIAHKLRSERQHDIAAVDVPRLFLIHDKQVITAHIMRTREQSAAVWPVKSAGKTDFSATIAMRYLSSIRSSSSLMIRVPVRLESL